MNDKAKQHFQKAKEQLNVANEELFKPKEDVVSYLVCKSSQHAIENYLKGYLSQRGFKTSENETMEGLLNRCKSLDPKFKPVNLEAIECKAHKIDSKYCQSVKRVTACYETADGLDTFLRKLNLI
jgi:HEPN domain-containing protein